MKVLHSREAFESILQYLYTGKLDLPLCLLKDCLVLCNALHLHELRRALKRKFRELGGRGKVSSMMNGVKHQHQQEQQQQMMIIVEPEKEEVVSAFKNLARGECVRY